MLSGGLVGLVLHLEHNGDILRIVLIVAEDEVALGATGGVVVLLEVSVREQGSHFPVERVAAVGLEGFADHLGGKACLQILVIVHLLLRDLQFGLVLLADIVLMEFGLLGSQLGRRTKLEEGCVQFRNLLVLGGDSGPDGQFLPVIHSVKLRLEIGNLAVFSEDGLFLLEQFRLVLLLRRHGLRLLLGLILRVQFFQPALDFSIEFGPADLGNDGSVVGLVDSENTPAFGAFKFVHICALFWFVHFRLIH